MRASDLIQRKRDGEPLQPDELKAFVKGYTAGQIPDYQASAFAMAVFFNGMRKDELAAFTHAMLHSGKVLNFSGLDGLAIDKHSTGGVGDKTSIPLAPAVAACGIYVPMISGRGLGHSGGTLDKLESIPGFNTQLSVLDFESQVKTLGCALIGQTEEIAPADRKLYSLRDVTATVECIPLIASSILSKKLAEGISGLVLDVKFGSGAFLPDEERAKTLAQTMVDLGTEMNTEIVARMTSMDEPLGQMVGNAMEIEESLDILEGRGPKDICCLVIELGAEMLLLGQKASSLEEGREKIREVLTNGKAMKKFAQIIEAQGGNADIISNRALLPRASKKTEVCADKNAYLQSIQTRSIGTASILLGGGRQTISDKIDPSVGIKMQVRVGDKIEKGQPLCTIYAAEKEPLEAITLLKGSFVFSDDKISKIPLFGPRITSK